MTASLTDESGSEASSAKISDVTFGFEAEATIRLTDGSGS